MVLGTAALVGLFAATTLIINLPVQGNDNDRKGEERNREDEGKLEVQLAIVLRLLSSI
jgi:hypothetical protein